MARIGLLAAVAAALLPAVAINAQQVSENDIFALYCLGTFRVVGAASAESYLTACPTGNEQHCDWMCKANKSNEDGLSRVKKYLAARGYLSGGQPRLISQIEVAARSGEDDVRRCLDWRMSNLKRSLHIATNRNSANRRTSAGTSPDCRCKGRHIGPTQESVMATEIIRAPSPEEVERKVADWKTAHPKARIVQEVAAFSRDPERGGWRVCIDYEEPGDKA